MSAVNLSLEIQFSIWGLSSEAYGEKSIDCNATMLSSSWFEISLTSSAASQSARTQTPEREDTQPRLARSPVPLFSSSPPLQRIFFSSRSSALRGFLFSSIDIETKRGVCLEDRVRGGMSTIDAFQSSRSFLLCWHVDNTTRARFVCFSPHSYPQPFDTQPFIWSLVSARRISKNRRRRHSEEKKPTSVHGYLRRDACIHMYASASCLSVSRPLSRSLSTFTGMKDVHVLDRRSSRKLSNL